MKKEIFLLFIGFLICTQFFAQNVGIGTTTPTSQLHTKGTLRHESLPTGSGNILVIDSLGNVFKSNLLSLPTLSRTEVLTKYTWRVDEVYQVISGVTKHYKRGGENTVGANYDTMRYTFKIDGTGTFRDALGKTYPSTWVHSSVDQNNIQFSYAGINILWALVSINETEFLQSSIGTTSVVCARLVPVFP